MESRDLSEEHLELAELWRGELLERIADGSDDVQALFELLMGMGMLIGEFVPFFIALAIMLAIDVELTLWLLLSIPIFTVITYFFRQATRPMTILVAPIEERHPQQLLFCPLMAFDLVM